MSQTFAFYDARAQEAARDAKAATLDNVRERALRSQKTWRALADQAKKIEKSRAKAASERLERLAAAEDAATAETAES
ncbi:hypothetical protein [Aurantiacibacter flavus]|uniref:Uncharacterized protein n=1 Tax=Aurantiacibacter flavus TaxID=3145232 RepID=A0ABV0CW94_9SPHN